MDLLPRNNFPFLLSLLFLPLLSSLADPSCDATERDLISRAFASVSGFQISQLLTPHHNCRGGGSSSVTGPPPPPITEIRLPSRNLTGTVSWMFLRNISTLRVVDLSHNALRGSVPSGFWSAPSLGEVNLASNRLGGTVAFDLEAGRRPSSPLRVLNLSGNRFTNTVRLSGFSRLRVLDLSRNDLRTLPSGLGELTELEHLDLSSCNISGEAKPIGNLRSLKYLDASHNYMNGSFPLDFPPLAGLEFLNISFNNFTGTVASEQFEKFSSSAFIRAGTLFRSNNAPKPSSSSSSSSSSSTKYRGGEEKRRHKKLSRAAVLGLAFSAAALSVLAIAVLAACLYRRKRIRMGKIKRSEKWTGMKTPGAWRAGEKPSGPFSFDTEARAAAWVAEIREAGSAAAAAPVVMFEKPLMRLSFSDLAAATSGFGNESQLAEGRRSGPVYRAILPGEMDVVVKVLEKAREMEAAEARAVFQELGLLKHPNLLPLLGYCIAGKEKLLLYEYMENGDLHRLLHELPAGHPNVEDWSTDTWEHKSEASRSGAHAAVSQTAMSWGTRHRIGLGIARGLAFLHHAGSRPVVHGHLVPSNVLLADDFEPLIADFGTSGADDGGGGTEADVYCYGVLLMELLTGRVGSEETVAWVRGLVRRGEGGRALDPRLRQLVVVGGGGDGSVEEKEMVEALRVGYLCTAESAEKRPTMQQVVGLLKDIRPCISLV